MKRIREEEKIKQKGHNFPVLEKIVAKNKGRILEIVMPHFMILRIRIYVIYGLCISHFVGVESYHVDVDIK